MSMTRRGFFGLIAVAPLCGSRSVARCHQFQITAKDRQFLEYRRFAVEDIARIFQVPPDLICDLNRATFSNLALQNAMASEYLAEVRPYLQRLLP